EPVPPDTVDGDERSLRPWLARIKAEAADGAWMTADAALDQWVHVADGWTKNAQAVLDANQLPVARRNELRGLVDSYQAKAAGTGQAESPELARLHDAARDALWTAPCNLQAAERLVRDYMDAINAAGPSDHMKER